MGNRHLLSTSFVAVLAAACSLAQAQGPKATLEKQLESEYALTTPTADNTDIVITGSVLILQKKGLSAGSVANKVPAQNTYQDGQIKSVGGALRKGLGNFSTIGSMIPGVGGVAGGAAGVAGKAGPARDFVNGEKLYVTKIAVDRAKNVVIFDLISDSYGDAGRYKASLRFELPKGAAASEDLTKVDPTIAEVFKIAPPADQNAAAAPPGQQAAPAAASAASAAAPVAQVQPPAPALEPIAPPPPPPPDPVVETKSLEAGQTKEQVVAILGKPDKTYKVGTKEIYQYKDIKVTFVNGKMTDAQ